MESFHRPRARHDDKTQLPFLAQVQLEAAANGSDQHVRHPMEREERKESEKRDEARRGRKGMREADEQPRVQ